MNQTQKQIAEIIKKEFDVGWLTTNQRRRLVNKLANLFEEEDKIELRKTCTAKGVELFRHFNKSQFLKECGVEG